MHLWDATTGDVASFTTTFTFDISSNVDSNKNGSSSEDGSSSCCDGLAFFLAPQNYSIPVGGGASGRLGLIYANLTYDSASENPFVAVEFDTYNNEWDAWNDSSHLYLVYDYMENGSLDSHLFGQEPGHQPLTWEIRFRIAKDLGSGLLYLHGGCTECVLHRDIKPANVLLDSRFRAKLSDFGLARVVGHDDRSQSLIYGSEGYLAPEVLETGKSTKSSDVFSFGVVALQIVSGKLAYVINNSAQRRHIVEWAWALYGEGHVEAVVDPKLNGVFVEEQVRRLLEVGLHCAHPDPSRRPRMKDAMDALNFRDPLALAPLPLQYPTNRSSQADLLSSLSRILEESPTVSSLQQPVLSSSGVVPPPHDQPVASIARARAAVSRLHRTV
ncbi:unnamed protein product [Linum tenue]|uniref:Protein kinase domain-containing protein n=2 Tax=Linum tenue TaxID=586396 RepID=A0AAV0QXW1_9ROSI|nr:unnamed protein product [Linum tenue]